MKITKTPVSLFDALILMFFFGTLNMLENMRNMLKK